MPSGSAGGGPHRGPRAGGSGKYNRSSGGDRGGSSSSSGVGGSGASSRRSAGSSGRGTSSVAASASSATSSSARSSTGQGQTKSLPSAGFLITCDPPAKQFIKVMNDGKSVDKKFIIEDLDATHLLIDGRAREEVLRRVEEWMDENVFSTIERVGENLDTS